MNYEYKIAIIISRHHILGMDVSSTRHRISGGNRKYVIKALFQFVYYGYSHTQTGIPLVLKPDMLLVDHHEKSSFRSCESCPTDATVELGREVTAKGEYLFWCCSIRIDSGRPSTQSVILCSAIQIIDVQGASDYLDSVDYGWTFTNRYNEFNIHVFMCSSSAV